jgi:hypothetical protein
MCRKQQGAAFRSAARISAADLRWIQGEDLVRFYKSSPGTFRGFCGSPIINRFNERSRSAAFRPAAVAEYGVALATLDDDPGGAGKIQGILFVWASECAYWLAIQHQTQWLTTQFPTHRNGEFISA